MKKAALVFLLSAIFSSIYSQEKRFIEVTGTANQEFPADQINWNFDIKKIAKSFDESKNQLDNTLNKLIAILNSANIDRHDIKISPIQQSRYYEFNQDRERVFKGFKSNCNLNFTLKDLTRYTELVSKLTELEEFEYFNTFYSDSNYELHHKATLLKASDEAKKKAEYLAENMGVRVGSVLEIQEANVSYPNPFNSSTSLQYDTPIQSGKVDYTRSVKIKFELIDKK